MNAARSAYWLAHSIFLTNVNCLPQHHLILTVITIILAFLLIMYVTWNTFLNISKFHILHLYIEAKKYLSSRI